MTIIVLNDRIKETSRDTGTGHLTLDGAVQGFTSFYNSYSSGDVLFYAISDGSEYEVGSGVFHSDGVYHRLERVAHRSTNSDNNVDFHAGVKEVYVTYPAKFSVFTSSGVEDLKQPEASGIAFWKSSQILNYDEDLLWNNSLSKLGISNKNPEHAIDIGGHQSYSSLNVSGVIVGNSGIMFSGENVAVRGRQTIPFQQNEFIDTETTNIEELIQFSGIVNEYIGLKKQAPSRVFAGPSGNCGCEEDYPSFRPLRFDDIDGVNQIINDSGNLAIPTYATTGDIISSISADQAGAIAFSTSDNNLMISNGTSWVKVQLST
jgi:hypothetical protein